MVKVNVDVTPRGITSAYVIAPFDQGKELLEGEGYRIISLQENARLRMQEGANHNVSKYGNWVREDAIYVPNKGKFLTKDPPIMTKAREAAQAHREGKDFYLTNEQVEQVLTDSVALTGESIPTNRFKDNPITVYAFGKDAENYGTFLKEAGIDEMQVWLADLQEKPFARKAWFGDLDDRSVLICVSGSLDCGDWVRGVQDSAEGTAKNLDNLVEREI